MGEMIMFQTSQIAYLHEACFLEEINHIIVPGAQGGSQKTLVIFIFAGQTPCHRNRATLLSL
jgi:hypothetical protein